MPFNKRFHSELDDKTSTEIKHTEKRLCRNVLTSDFFFSNYIFARCIASQWIIKSVFCI